MPPQEKTRKRRTSEEMFLARLSKLATRDDPLVRNHTLRERLRWDDEKYKKVKKALKDDGKIAVGLGYGGKVGLAQHGSPKGLNIFVSYSHTDEVHKTNLLKHLDPLRRLGYIETWHDEKISPGKQIDKAITQALSTADIILLLVSIDYINSYYCMEMEMEAALKKHESGIARVIPVIVRNCLWKSMKFGNLKALPTDGKAIAAWENPDEAFVPVAEGIEHTAKELSAKGR